MTNSIKINRWKQYDRQNDTITQDVIKKNSNVNNNRSDIHLQLLSNQVFIFWDWVLLMLPATNEIKIVIGCLLLIIMKIEREDTS